MSDRLPSRIVGSGLTIQRWTTTDIHPMQTLIADNLDHLRPCMAWAAQEPITPQQRRQLFKQWDHYWALGKGAVYSIRLDSELVGGCAIHRRSESNGVEIGYWLAKKATGRGIATRTARALTTAAFGLDDIDFVRISHENSNTHSGAVAERLGYVPEATQTPDAKRWRIDRNSWSLPQGQ